MNGQGKKIFYDGDYFEGEFFDDKKQGKGVYIWANSDKYEG